MSDPLVETAEPSPTLLVLAFEGVDFGRVGIITEQGEVVHDEVLALDALVLDREAERRFVLRLVLPSLLAEQFSALVTAWGSREGA